LWVGIIGAELIAIRRPVVYLVHPVKGAPVA